ncbi:hypothetical protein AMATHDRAFT_134838 [Amanita thiersii Skay4041]|uniref:Uncharacterized protein n=1 Tax=Amanita thiersii Skay4041 TaxID=703135 RepID=A0A2A9P1M7_9AGAR|nr:hypothetical protein AMATHDRAFT_134838 [Amanita thiersii Skay4041]
MSPSPHNFSYNIRWVELTFTSPSITEQLLSPERESGNISYNDYQLATRFLPASHRHYRYIGALSPIPVVYAFRKPSWSLTKTCTLLSLGCLAGSMIGHSLSILKHYKFVRAIENPVGFSRAFNNIQNRIGGVVPQGPVIVRVSEQDDLQSSDMHGTMELSPAQPNNTSPTSGPTATKPLSKWDQIRADSARSTPASSWDAIRQTHEMARLAKSGIPVKTSPQESQSNDRSTEQAEFDALLERERRMSGGGGGDTTT